MASKVTDHEYNLLLQNDINTNGYSQWFFFKVTNTHKGFKVKFKILNQYKLNNLYKMGMKIIIYSKK
jgi:cytosolic carboxypeptidase protein 2/3